MSQLQAALRDVVKSDHGTGKKARVDGIEVAGKTGTSQVVRLKSDRKVEPTGCRASSATTRGSSRSRPVESAGDRRRVPRRARRRRRRRDRRAHRPEGTLALLLLTQGHDRRPMIDRRLMRNTSTLLLLVLVATIVSMRL